jgi:hypothetical protein
MLPLDTSCRFSGKVLIIQADAKLRNPLKIKAGMIADDS